MHPGKWEPVMEEGFVYLRPDRQTLRFLSHSDIRFRAILHPKNQTSFLFEVTCDLGSEDGDRNYSMHLHSWGEWKIFFSEEKQSFPVSEEEARSGISLAVMLAESLQSDAFEQLGWPKSPVWLVAEWLKVEHDLVLQLVKTKVALLESIPENEMPDLDTTNTQIFRVTLNPSFSYYLVAVDHNPVKGYVFGGDFCVVVNAVNPVHRLNPE
jgi:hypothetical protein